jgi:hypothetical protein
VRPLLRLFLWFDRLERRWAGWLNGTREPPAPLPTPGIPEPQPAEQRR